MQPLEWISEQFEQAQTISESLLRASLPADKAEKALLMLHSLATKGVIDQARNREGLTFMIRSKDALRRAIEDRGIPDRASADEACDDGSISLATESLVVAVPPTLSGKLRALQARYTGLPIQDMKTAFKVLLGSAQREVLLSVPFLELDGLLALEDEVRQLGVRQVHICALTRELLNPNRFDYGHMQKVRAFGKLIDLFLSSGGDPNAVEVRDYTVKVGERGDQSLIYEGIHQKMMIIDRTRAYIGSGEIRASSFLVNGDVGVVQTGTAAAFWAEYFLIFWSEAQEVQHSLIRSLLR